MGSPFYGSSPVVPILSSPRSLGYCHTQGSTMMMIMIRVEDWAASIALSLSLESFTTQCFKCWGYRHMLLQWAQKICFLFKLWCGCARVCKCVYIHVCKNISPCLCEEARRGQWLSSSIIIPLRQEVLSLNLMLGWQSASPQICLSPSPHRAGVVGASSHVKLYLWALETWTKVLTLVRQELLSWLPATPGRFLKVHILISYFIL